MSQISSSKIRIRDNTGNRLLIYTVIFSLIVTALALSSYLWDHYRVARDVQNFYWMARAQDPALFPIDYLYITDEVMIQTNILGFHLLLYPLSLGYGLIFYLSSAFLDYIWLTKLSIILLMTVAIVYLFKTGEKLNGGWTGVSLSLFFVFFILASPLSISIVSGLQRAFALPLMIIFLYYLIRQNYPAAAIMIVASALIYLPNFPPMVIAYTLSIVRIEYRSKFSVSLHRGGLRPIIIALLSSGVFVMLALAVQLGLLSTLTSSETTFAQNSTENVTEEARYNDQGTTPLFIGYPFLGRAGLFDTGGDVVNFLVLLTFSMLILRVLGRSSLQRVPRQVWLLMSAGLVMYFVSLFFVFGLSSFALYLPSRYTRSTLFLTSLFFVGINWVDFAAKMPTWSKKNLAKIAFFCISFIVVFAIVYLISPKPQLLIPTFWFIGIIVSGLLVPLGVSSVIWMAAFNQGRQIVRWGSITLLTLVVVYLSFVYIDILGAKTTNPSTYERDIYEFVATLPKDAMLAGDPYLMTNIPLFSKRSVLFRELFPGTDSPIVEYFDAQYQATYPPILEFCQHYKISHLLLNEQHFALEYLTQGDFFYEPWNSQIVELVEGRTEFALLDLEPIFTSGPYRVIKCDAETFLAASQEVK